MRVDNRRVYKGDILYHSGGRGEIRSPFTAVVEESSMQVDAGDDAMSTWSCVLALPQRKYARAEIRDLIQFLEDVLESEQP